MRNTDKIAPLCNILGGQRDTWAQYLRNRRWGSCPSCPTSVVQNQTFPELCVNTNRSDHHRTFEEHVEFYRLKRPQVTRPKPSTDAASIKVMHDIAMGARFRGDCHDAFHQFVRNGRWGNCPLCPYDQETNLYYPERCQNKENNLHRGTLKQLFDWYEGNLRRVKSDSGYEDNSDIPS